MILKGLWFPRLFLLFRSFALALARFALALASFALALASFALALASFAVAPGSFAQGSQYTSVLIIIIIWKLDLLMSDQTAAEDVKTTNRRAIEEDEYDLEGYSDSQPDQV